jgi:hypothetical protein
VTYREVLEVIAEATGTVARFDRNGALDLRYFELPTINGSAISIDTDTVGNQCLALDVAEYKVSRIDLLRAKFAEGDLGVTVGSGTNEYVITNNLFLNGANTAAITSKLTPIYNRLYYFIARYTPVSGRFIWDWSIEAGDMVGVVNNGTTYNVPIFQQTMTWRGGYVVSDLICDGDKTRPVLDSATRDYYRLDSDMRTLVIEAPRINLLGYTTINNGFKVNLDGTFEANGATINGSIETSSGSTKTELKDGVLKTYYGSNLAAQVGLDPDAPTSGALLLQDKTSSLYSWLFPYVHYVSDNGYVSSISGRDITLGTGTVDANGIPDDINPTIRLSGSTGEIFSNGIPLFGILSGGTAITANSDFNNYIDAGVYTCTYAVATTLTNSNITTVGFKMIVMDNGADKPERWQLCLANFSNCIIAVRWRSSSSVWQSWKRITPA